MFEGSLTAKRTLGNRQGPQKAPGTKHETTNLHKETGPPEGCRQQPEQTLDSELVQPAARGPESGPTQIHELA